MKRWAAITALAVMAVPIAPTIGVAAGAFFVAWRWRTAMVTVGRSHINPYGVVSGSDLIIATLALLATVGWWIGWRRLGPAPKPAALIAAPQILATEFLFLVAAPPLLILNNLSLF